MVKSIGIIEPRTPINMPSSTSGDLMYELVAPTNLIIPISSFLELIVIFIVLYIKKIASKAKAITKIVPTSLMPFNNLTKSSTVAPPKSTD